MNSASNTISLGGVGVGLMRPLSLSGPPVRGALSHRCQRLCSVRARKPPAAKMLA